MAVSRRTEMEIDMPDKLARLTYSVEEAGQLLGLSRQGAYDAVRRGEIPSIRLGRRLVVPKAALLRIIDGAAPQSPVA